MKLWRTWIIILFLILFSLGSAYLSELVYQGKSENLGLSRFWGLLFWLFISAASGTEGLLVARLFSKIKEKNISATPFVIIFTIISVVGFSPISLMTIIGSLMVILFPIFTIVLLLITIIESLNSRFRKIN